jgi:hypothetical protein
MPQPIEKLIETADDRIFALLVGDSGSGKTSTIPYFPGRKLILDVDKRWKGLLGHRNPEYPMNKPSPQIDVHHFPGKDILVEMEELFNGYESLVQRKQQFPYDLIVVDGFTSLDALISDDAIRYTGGLVGKTNDRGGALTTGNKKFGNLDLMGWDAFAYELQGFKNIITALKYQVPCNVICTAHWTDRYEEGKVVGRDINLRKKIINQVILWFDEVYYFEKKTSNVLKQNGESAVQTKHIVHFRNDLARTTYPLLQDSMDWTDKNFFEILQKGKRGE